MPVTEFSHKFRFKFNSDPIQCEAIRIDCGCYGQHQAARISNAGEQRKHSIKSVDKLRRASKVTHCANGATTNRSFSHPKSQPLCHLQQSSMEIYRLFLFREFSVGIDTKAPVPTLFRDIKLIAEGAKSWESTWVVTYGPPFE